MRQHWLQAVDGLISQRIIILARISCFAISTIGIDDLHERAQSFPQWGAVGNGFTIYGGTNSGDLEGNPTIHVNNTGSGTWNIYGATKAAER